MSDITHDRSEGDINLGPRRRRWRDGLDRSTRDLLDRDAAAFVHQSLSTPCLDVLVGASGHLLHAESGRSYIDCHGNSVHQLGHGHPRVLAAIQEQLVRLPFCPRRFANQPATALAERLQKTAPIDAGRVLFAPGGSEAISMALKLARIATGRYKTISWWDSFHGATLDAIAIGGERIFRERVGPLVPGAIRVPPPDAGMRTRSPSLAALGDPDYIGYVMRHEGEIAAVVAEPLRWTTVSPIPADYWPRVRRLCDEHGALLIFDEIPLGLGRSGHLFASEMTGVRPDIVCLGKGLGGGVMPLAAIIARGGLNVAGDLAIGHFTHEKSPVACAAGLAALDVILSEDLPGRARRLGATAAVRLRSRLADQSRVADIRQIGLMVGIDMVDGEGRPDDDGAEALLYECLQRGLSFKTSGHTAVLAPPLTIPEEALERVSDILVDAVAALPGSSGRG